MSKMESCVSLYSLQNEYMTGEMSLEAIFGFLRDNNIHAIEILPDQMLHGTPYPSEDEVTNWHRLIKEYGMKPVCDDIFMNTNLYANRTLRKQECVSMLKAEIDMAHQLGFKLIRLVSMVPADMIEPVLPYAEKHGITLALEIHAGLSFDNPKTDAFIKEIRRLNSPYLGLVIDTSIFCRRPPRVTTEYYRAMAPLSDSVVEYIANLYKGGSDIKKEMLKNGGGFSPELTALFQNDNDIAYARNLSGYENESFKLLDAYMPFIKHFHFKLYEMTDDGIEYSIDYKGLMAYLKEKGYEGYLATEYEGNRWTLPGQPFQEKAQVLAHQKMIQQYIAELNM